MLHRPQTALPYYGGKSTADAANAGVGKWVASLLPTDCTTYVETHCGMLGVLLSRQPAPNEIANDLNGRVINWWLVVRDEAKCEELRRLFDNTPVSDDIYSDYRLGMDEGDDVERALKFMYVIKYNVIHGDGDTPPLPPLNTTKSNHRWASSTTRVIHELRKRTREVHFTNRPALKLLNRLADIEDAVIYVDPPYASARTAAYAVVQHDHFETLEALKRQRGRVAVSGYNDEWDDLLEAGWNRSEYRTFTVISANASRRSTERTEVLWTNYVPVTQGELI